LHPLLSARALIGCSLAIAACVQCGPGSRTPASPTTSIAEAPRPAEPSKPVINSVRVGVAANADALVAPGAKLQLWAVETYDDGSTADATNLVQWQSSNPGVAAVSAAGVLTAGEEGSVTVSAVREKTGTLEVRVRTPGCEDLQLSPASQTISAIPNYCYDCVAAHQFVVTAPSTSCRWTAASDATWLSIQENNTNQQGSAPVRFRLEQNERPTQRVGHVTVFIGARRLVHTVTQEAAACTLTINPKERTLTKGARSFFDVYPDHPDCKWFARETSGITLVEPGVKTGADRIEYIVNEDATFWRTYIDVRDADYRGRWKSHRVEIPVK
jgi:hypothetical protein